MKTADLLSAPFQIGAALRNRRFFHPVESCAVVARVSKGLGTPGSLPDFAGLAWQMPPSAFAATPWDVLLVSAAERLLFRPVTSWSQAAYSSVMPVRYGDDDDGRLWWVRARLRTSINGGVSLDALRATLSQRGLQFDIEQACGAGEFTPLARMGLTGPMTGDGADVAFDPVRHTAQGLALWPGWLRAVRGSAYRGSREGRHGD